MTSPGAVAFAERYGFYTGIPGALALPVPAPIVVTRPNNILAYAAGQVFGDAADARITIPVPALPADAVQPYFENVSVVLVNSRGPGGPALTLMLYLSPVQFTTVLGDRTLLTLSDPEIAAFPGYLGGVGGSALQFPLPVGNGADGIFNHAADPNGRRGACNAGVLNTGSDNYPLTPNVYGYLVVNAAYNPIALETVTLQLRFTYSRKISFP